MGRSDSRVASAWRIGFGVKCTMPVMSVVVTTMKALVLSLNISSMTSMRLTRAAAAAAMMV